LPSGGALRRIAVRAMSLGMDWIITLAVIVILAALTVYAGWKSGRPRKDSVRPQWISWPFVTVLAGALLAFAVVHAMNLMGIHTGQNTTGRYGG
jgi:uncharacterized membrane protein